jgi:hypothetical protein
MQGIEALGRFPPGTLYLDLLQFWPDGANDARSTRAVSAALSIPDYFLRRSNQPLSARALNRLRDSLLRGGLGGEHYPQGKDRR